MAPQRLGVVKLQLARVAALAVDWHGVGLRRRAPEGVLVQRPVVGEAGGAPRAREVLGARAHVGVQRQRVRRAEAAVRTAEATVRAQVA